MYIWFEIDTFQRLTYGWYVQIKLHRISITICLSSPSQH